MSDVINAYISARMMGARPSMISKYLSGADIEGSHANAPRRRLVEAFSKAVMAYEHKVFKTTHLDLCLGVLRVGERNISDFWYFFQWFLILIVVFFLVLVAKEEIPFVGIFIGGLMGVVCTIAYCAVSSLRRYFSAIEQLNSLSANKVACG